MNCYFLFSCPDYTGCLGGLTSVKEEVKAQLTSREDRKHLKTNLLRVTK